MCDVQNIEMVSAISKRSGLLSKQMINSFVFFDLETTDLIRGRNMPKVTELALVAISRKHLQVPQKRLPRVMSKLVIPIYPNTHIPEVVTKVTQLSVENLENAKPFDAEVVFSVMCFIKRLESPVCFVAHNGKKFDFPILLKEFRDVNQEIPQEILSIDSLEAFRYFYSEARLIKKQKLGDEEAKNGILEKYDSLLKDSWDDAVSAALDTVETFPSFDEGIEIDKTENFDKNNETYSEMQALNERTPESQLVKSERITNEISHKNHTQPFLKKPDNWKLSIIFKHMMGFSADNQHNAEGDCLTLLRCANQIGEYFIEFADENAMPLTTFERK